MMLNGDSPLPLYRQLADRLLGEIRSGVYPVGARIPSEPELARRYQIGRPTVRQATDLLIRQRLLERRRGAGTFVCPPPKQVDLFSLAGTSASFLEQGIQVKSRYVTPPHQVQLPPSDSGPLRSTDETGPTDEPGPGDEADTRHPLAGQRVYALSRVSLVDQVPVLLEEIQLVAELFPGLDGFDLTRESLSRIVAERYFLRPVRGRQSFRAGTLDGARARALRVDTTTPVLIATRTLEFGSGDPGIFARLFCRTDRFVFSQTLEAPHGAEDRIDG